MIRHEDGERAEIQFFIDPVDLSQANATSLKIGGYYERHPWGVKLSNTPATTEEYVAKYGYEPQLLTPALAAVRIAEWTHGAHLIGGVPSFDEESMALLLQQHQQVPAWHYHMMDIENMMVGYLLAQAQMETKTGALVGILEAANFEMTESDLLPPWNSERLAGNMGVNITEADRHTALGDARWVERCWLKMFGDVAAVKD